MAEQPVPDKTVMTERGETSGKLLLRTPSGEANVEVVALQWWKQALIRGSRVYLQSLVGFLVAAGTGAASAVGVNLPVGDFGQLLLSSASLAIAPAVISLLQNSVEILTRLDTTTPEMRA